MTKKKGTIWFKIFSQHNTGPQIGALINVYSSTGILYSPLTFLGVVTTVYGLWGGTFIRSYFPWFTTSHLMGLLVIFMLIMMGVFYKVVIPSMYAFQVSQQYKHRNPLVADLAKVLKKLDEISDRLEALEKKD